MYVDKNADEINLMFSFILKLMEKLFYMCMRM